MSERKWSPAREPDRNGESGLQADLHSELYAYRSTIDRLDADLVRLLGERFAVTERVGLLKARHGLPALDAARESDQVTRLRQLAAEAAIDGDIVEAVFREITAAVRRRHEALNRWREDSTADGV